MTIKITVESKSGSERTYINPQDFYIYRNQAGTELVVLSGQEPMIMGTALETQILPATNDERLWLCYRFVEDDGTVEVSIDQYQVVGWKLNLSLTNGEQEMLPISPGLDFTMTCPTSKNFQVLLINRTLAIAYPIRELGHGGVIEMDVENKTDDPLGYLADKFGVPVTADMLPDSVFNDGLQSKLIAPTTSTKRSK
jgi:hypothetical protein